jgi:hypothetical protein
MRLVGSSVGLVALTLGFAVASSACVRPKSAAQPPTAAMTESLRAARALDQQGVIAFEAGRYRDALVFFDAAFAHGGPASERWNAAKCYLRLDEPDKADAELSAYLQLPDLAWEDRRDGEALLLSLRRRSSPLTVVSTPLGLPVSLDGRRVGVTPLTTPLAPGDHVVLVEGPGEAARVVTARLGRAILVEAHP